ncbi:hypothetical protein OG241_13680 [Streptomyces sp. NBC_01390]|uniref:hypothetical protein n=1 Tax=Streptomyces sp. NBC_01390 TaxID=2903850 RepID=UPI003253BC76
MTDGKAWIGDEVYDEDAGRTGIITDVRSGVYILRPVSGGGAEWTSDNSDRLTIKVPREKQALS